MTLGQIVIGLFLIITFVMGTNFEAANACHPGLFHVDDDWVVYISQN
jgi:hypothetical protein